MNVTLFSIIASLIGIAIGYFLKFYLEKKKELTNEVNKERRQTYQKFIDLFLDILSKTKNYSDIQLRKEMYSFYKKNILYASPSVVKAVSIFMQYAYKSENEDLDPKITLMNLARIVKTMITDLGLSNKRLGKNGEELLKALIKDFDSVVRS